MQASKGVIVQLKRAIWTNFFYIYILYWGQKRETIFACQAKTPGAEINRKCQL